MPALLVEGDMLLPHAPSDTTSCLRWSSTGNWLAASAWNGQVRIWEVGVNGGVPALRTVVSQEAPILAIDWTPANLVLMGGLDGQVRLADLSRSDVAPLTMGTHLAPVKSVLCNGDTGLCISGSWDKTIRFWDPRTSTSATSAVHTVSLPVAVHALDNRGHLVVAALADRCTRLYDMRNCRDSLREFEPFSRFASTAVSLFPDGRSHALASIEGRVMVRAHDNPSDSFSFRCHRSEHDEQQVYAVNGLATTDRHEAFATIGGDGTYVFWHKRARKRLHLSKPAGAPLTACSWSRDGALFAYACGNDWSRGANANANFTPAIGLHLSKSAEIAPVH